MVSAVLKSTGGIVKRIFSIVFISAFLMSCIAFQTPSFASENNLSTVDSVLAQSGYSFAKKTSNVWTIDFTGKSLPNFKVIISTGSGLVVMFVTIVKKDQIQLSPEALYKMAKINHNLDRIKVGIDTDEDIFVRIDLSERVLDVKELRTNVDQLAAAADETYEALKPYMKTAK